MVIAIIENQLQQQISYIIRLANYVAKACRYQQSPHPRLSNIHHDHDLFCVESTNDSACLHHNYYHFNMLLL